MSTDPEERDETAVAPEAVPAREPKDHRQPLTQCDVFELLLRDTILRPYVFAALGSLAMIFLVMFLNGSDIGAVIVVLFGLAIIIFRWIAGPPFLLLILFYFLLFPFGIPDIGTADSLEVRNTHFRLVDVILVMAVLVYIRSTYRIFGLILQAVPFENVFRVRGEHPLRRPLSHIEPGEVLWMIGVTAALVILGQIVWWLVNSFEFTPGEDFPLRWAGNGPARYRRRDLEPGEFTPGLNRFYVMLGALFFGFLIIRLVFGYWRLRMMNAGEGAMVLTDTSWSESHRERVRVEKWRIWGHEKAKEQAKKKAKTERVHQEKGDAERKREEREERKGERKRAEPESRRRENRRQE
jgi:hypothetical protein